MDGKSFVSMSVVAARPKERLNRREKRNEKREMRNEK